MKHLVLFHHPSEYLPIDIMNIVLVDMNAQELLVSNQVRGKEYERQHRFLAVHPIAMSRHTVNQLSITAKKSYLIVTIVIVDIMTIVTIVIVDVMTIVTDVRIDAWTDAQIDVLR